MSLVHHLCFLSPLRPSAHRSRRHLTDVDRSRPRPTTTTHDDTGPLYNVWVACRARIETLGAGMEAQGVHHGARGCRYALARLTRLLASSLGNPTATARRLHTRVRMRSPSCPSANAHTNTHDNTHANTYAGKHARMYADTRLHAGACRP
ncbi:hypothetical protein PHLGIDRAFT_266378 [Phlebiopsis gigantea 11061_1 CR5-6]|uniref:Uncharacterized protein n=1 Tax=Phlebiopsis gigantea (strain 11061_1 CR5-6) TaxID=745531 RepID=A0A0C3PS99_PHLG1|nr:hypothetical protein PHLGIDRAFT_266378 [Phlebiopsis gigantea 11061_1 CR5-6]